MRNKVSIDYDHIIPFLVIKKNVYNYTHLAILYKKKKT